MKACRYGLVEQLRAEGAEPVLVPGEDPRVLNRLRPQHVVLNAEGTLHHGCGEWLLDAIAVAKSVGARVTVTNAVLQALPEAWAETLRLADTWLVREPRSLAVAEALGLRARLAADTLTRFPWSNQRSRYLKDRVVLGCGHPDVCRGVFEELAERVPGAARLPLDVPDWRHLRENLRGCRLYVTGRFHGTLIAWSAGCPVLSLPSNSHKLEGLYELVESRNHVARPEEVLAEMDRALSERWRRECLRNAETYRAIAERLRLVDERRTR